MNVQIYCVQYAMHNALCYAQSRIVGLNNVTI